jgi:RNA polymerase sigma factor (sigma-70 family)
VLAAKRGDRLATETLVLTHPPVRGVVEKIKKDCDPKRIARGWEPMPERGAPDESEAAARLAVLDALDRYDPDRGVAFTTFAYPSIKGAVLRAIYPTVRRASAPNGSIARLVGLDQTADDRAPDLGFEAQLLGRDPEYGQEAGFGRLVVADGHAAVRTFVSGLPVKQQEVVREIYWEGRSAADIAAERGVSRQAVSKLLNKALARGREHFDPAEVVAA